MSLSASKDMRLSKNKVQIPTSVNMMAMLDMNATVNCLLDAEKSCLAMSCADRKLAPKAKSVITAYIKLSSGINRLMADKASDPKNWLATMPSVIVLTCCIMLVSIDTARKLRNVLSII